MSDTKRPDRLSQVSATDLRPDSLVGTYFHSDADRGWQGCIVAEPAFGTYLVELFSWLTGTSTQQNLIRLEDMTGWRFYDDAEWMNNAYNNGLDARWERERAESKS